MRTSFNNFRSPNAKMESFPIEQDLAEETPMEISYPETSTIAIDTIVEDQDDDKCDKDDMEKGRRQRKKIDKEAASLLYKGKIQDAIYNVTGCDTFPEDIDIIVKDIESEVLQYIEEIRENANVLTSTRKRKKPKPISLDDIYKTLEGTPEYYGTKRVVLEKKMAKKVASINAETDIPDDIEMVAVVDPDKDDIEGEEEEIEEDLNELQTAFKKLNDGTDAYNTFEEGRIKLLERRDKMTIMMTKDEYIKWNRLANVKFTRTKESLCLWLNWPGKPSDHVVLVLGWLCVYKTRTIIQEAVKRRFDIREEIEKRCTTDEKHDDVLSMDMLTFDKTIPLNVSDFMKDDQKRIAQTKVEYWRLLLKFNEQSKNIDIIGSEQHSDSNTNMVEQHPDMMETVLNNLEPIKDYGKPSLDENKRKTDSIQLLQYLKRKRISQQTNANQAQLQMPRKQFPLRQPLQQPFQQPLQQPFQQPFQQFDNSRYQLSQTEIQPCVNHLQRPQYFQTNFQQQNHQQPNFQGSPQFPQINLQGLSQFPQTNFQQVPSQCPSVQFPVETNYLQEIENLQQNHNNPQQQKQPSISPSIDSALFKMKQHEIHQKKIQERFYQLQNQKLLEKMQKLKQMSDNKLVQPMQQPGSTYQSPLQPPMQQPGSTYQSSLQPPMQQPPQSPQKMSEKERKTLLLKQHLQKLNPEQRLEFIQRIRLQQINSRAT